MPAEAKQKSISLVDDSILTLNAPISATAIAAAWFEYFLLLSVGQLLNEDWNDLQIFQLPIFVMNES